MQNLFATTNGHSPLTLNGVIIITVISCLIGLAWAFFNYLNIKKINIQFGAQGQYENIN